MAAGWFVTLRLYSGEFLCYHENVLTAEQIRRIDNAVQQVATAGHGAVVIVIERGRARRLRVEADLSWDTDLEQVLQLNDGTVSKK